MRRLLVLVCVLALAASCSGGEDERTFRPGDAVRVSVGDEFTIELDDDDGSAFAAVIDGPRLDEVVDDLETVPGVKQVARFAGDSVTTRFQGFDVEVFFVLGHTPAQRAEVEARVARLDDVEVVAFVTQEEQYEQFVEYFADQPEYLENVVPEDLPASLRLDVLDPTLRRIGDDDELRFEAVGAGTTSIVAGRAPAAETGAPSPIVPVRFEVTVTAD